MNLSPEHSDAIRTLVQPDILLNRIRGSVRILTVTTYPDIAGTDTRARRITRPALLTQLRDAIRPDIGRTMAGAGDGRPIPLGAAALELLAAIEAEIASAYESARDKPATGTAEQLLADWYEAFARADARGEINLAQLENYAERLSDWAIRIEEYFDPPRVIEYPICPVCEYTDMIRLDDAGDPIRVRCLTLRHHPSGRAIATCRYCNARWQGVILPAGASIEFRELHQAIQTYIDEHGPITTTLAPTDSPEDTTP